MKTSTVWATLAVSLFTAINASASSNLATVTAERLESLGGSIQQLARSVQQDLPRAVALATLGPGGETIKTVGEITAQEAQYLASLYHSTGNTMNCIASNPANPFNDAACLTSLGGRVVGLSVVTAGNNTKTIVIAAAGVMSYAFDSMYTATLNLSSLTGGMTNPVGAAFFLTYKIGQAAEAIIQCLIVNSAERTIDAVVANGTSLVRYTFGAAGDAVNLRADKVAVKSFNFPAVLLNSATNIALSPTGARSDLLKEAIFDPAGSAINKFLGIDSNSIRRLME
jgi:hypothetical protein